MKEYCKMLKSKGLILSLILVMICFFNSLNVCAATKQASLTNIDKERDLAVMFLFDKEIVDLTFVSPSGKKVTSRDDGVGYTNGELWCTYRIPNAEIGEWSIEYDLKGNKEIEYSIIRDDLNEDYIETEQDSGNRKETELTEFEQITHQLRFVPYLITFFVIMSTGTFFFLCFKRRKYKLEEK